VIISHAKMKRGADSQSRTLWPTAWRSAEGLWPTIQLIQVWIPLRLVVVHTHAKVVQAFVNQIVRCCVYLHIHNTHADGVQARGTLALARAREQVGVVDRSGLTLDDTLDRLEWSECSG